MNVPFREDPTHTYHQIKQKVCLFYGVDDAEAYYTAQRKAILDKCKPDPFGIAPHETLKTYWEAKQMEAKWKSDTKPSNELTHSSEYAVEIYRVRSPGAGGELGVLTTAHDMDVFVNGLAEACAKYLCGVPEQRQEKMESDLRWILRNSFPIAFKLSGYKADQVVERHMFMCGSNSPAADDIVASA